MLGQKKIQGLSHVLRAHTIFTARFKLPKCSIPDRLDIYTRKKKILWCYECSCIGLFQINCALPHRGCPCNVCKKSGILLAFFYKFCLEIQSEKKTRKQKYGFWMPVWIFFSGNPFENKGQDNSLSKKVCKSNLLYGGRAFFFF